MRNHFSTILRPSLSRSCHALLLVVMGGLVVAGTLWNATREFPQVPSVFAGGGGGGGGGGAGGAQCGLSQLGGSDDHIL